MPDVPREPGGVGAVSEREKVSERVGSLTCMCGGGMRWACIFHGERGRGRGPGGGGGGREKKEVKG